MRPTLIAGLSAAGLAAVLAAEVLGSGQDQSCAVGCYFTRANEALASNRASDAIEPATRAVARAPDLPIAVQLLARVYALAGRSADALRMLERLADIGAAFDAASDSAFRSMRSSADFQHVQARLTRNRQPIAHGSEAFTLADPDLLPESMARDPHSGDWLVGSLAKRKIVRVGRDGTTTDFIRDPGMLRVVGMHVDSARSRLWFATWAPDTGSAAGARTRLFECELPSGRIVRRYEPAAPDGSHLFNDLAIAPNGDVFISDTFRSWIWRVRAGSDSLEVFLRLDEGRFTGSNGITMSPDGRTLFVAHFEGIARIDVLSRDVVRIATPARGTSASGDGLYWYRGDLIAVQHRPGLDQVARLRLSAGRDSIRDIEVLDRGEDIARLPTTGVLVGDRFYYIATSQYDRLALDGRLAPANPPRGSTVRVIELRGRS